MAAQAKRDKDRAAWLASGTEVVRLLVLLTKRTNGKTVEARLQITKAALELSVRRLCPDLARGDGTAGKFVDGAKKQVSAAIAASGLLVSGVDGRRWCDPRDRGDLVEVHEKLEAGAVARRRELVAELQFQVGTAARQPAAAAGAATATIRPAVGANVAAQAPHVGHPPPARRHGLRHCRYVEAAWVKATTQGRRQAHRSLSEPQAKYLHKAFWQFCRYQRQLKRLRVKIVAMGGWAVAEQRVAAMGRAERAAFADLRSRKAESGAIRMRQAGRVALFRGASLAAVHGRSAAQVVTGYFESWRRVAGGAKLAQVPKPRGG